MTEEVSIRAIKNAWVILYKDALIYTMNEESFKTFDEAIERLKDILNVEFTEGRFIHRGAF